MPSGYRVVDYDHFASGSASTLGYTSCNQNALTISSCGSLGPLVGGYGRMGRSCWLQKVFSLPPGHTSLMLRFTFFNIDSWDSEYLRVHVDAV